MYKAAAFILLVSLLFAGCNSLDTASSTESSYEQAAAQIERLKAEAAPTPAPNIRLVVNIITTNSNDYSSIESLWRYVKPESSYCESVDVFSKSGLRAALAGDAFRVKFNLADTELLSIEQSELSLLVSDGYPGYINIGREIAVPRFYYFGRWYSGVDYDFRRAGRSLKVIARKLPDGLINVELTPVFSRFLNDGGDMELIELKTHVTLRPAQLVVIGSVDSSVKKMPAYEKITLAETVAAALFTSGTWDKKNQTIITVTPYLK